MKLFKVTNGFRGHTDISVLVIAKYKKQALDLARVKFKKENPDYPAYYSNLEAEVLFNNCDKAKAGNVVDDYFAVF